MADNNGTYDMLLRLVKTRASVRKFRPDPFPAETIDKFLEVACWALSGAKSHQAPAVIVEEKK